MKKPFVIGVTVLVALLLVRVGFSLASSGDDKTEIQDALQNSLKASKEGRTGGVMDLLSSKLTVNNQEASSTFPQVISFIKSNKPDITVQNTDPVIMGDQAEIDSPVDVTLRFFTQERSIHLKHVALVFKKEHTMKWVIFPTTQWHLVQVQSDDSLPTDLVQ